MITIDGKEYRNLEEQVRKNKEDIEYILEEEGALNQFGIKVVGQVDTAASLPDPTTYTGEYGDAYAVGTAPPYGLYIWTRANGTHPNAYWFNIGAFPLAGPKGDKGDKGDTGAQGPKGDTGAQGPPGQTGATGSQGPIGPQGPQGVEGKVGATGPKGDPGDPFVIAGKLTSIDLLPNPSTVGRNTAYLIPDSIEPGTYDMYVITGDTTLTWENAGHAQSVQGPKGDTGAQGPQGSQGPIGPQGPQGSSTFIYDGVLSTSVQSVPIAQITVPSGKILQVGDILISSYADSVGAFARVTSLNSTTAGVAFAGTFQTQNSPIHDIYEGEFDESDIAFFFSGEKNDTRTYWGTAYVYFSPEIGAQPSIGGLTPEYSSGGYFNLIIEGINGEFFISQPGNAALSRCKTISTAVSMGGGFVAEVKGYSIIAGEGEL